MQNLIGALILLIIVGAAARYVYKAKKNGARCIGCSAAGCCSAKGNTASDSHISLTPEILAAFPHSYTLKADGMVCSGCARHVEKAFFSAGYLCRAEHTSGLVEVKSKAPVDTLSLNSIVIEAGYTVVE